MERVFEGVFGRAFRTNVQPVELARKLAKEMDEHRSTSVTRVYVPNEYTIYLSPGDREQFEGYENSLVSELEEYLSEHASRENYALLTPPRVLLETDDDLGVGEFGIATRMAQYGTAARGEDGAAGPGVRRDDDLQAAGRSRPRPPRRRPRRRAGGRRAAAGTASDASLEKQRSVLGRSRDCRHPDRGPERLAPPRRDRAGGLDVLDRRPRLDERDGGERPARPAREARRRLAASRSARRRSPSRPSGNRSAVTMLASTGVAEVLLVLKIAFLVLLYLFVLRVIRSAGRGQQAPSQESMILTPGAAAAAGSAASRRAQVGAARRPAQPEPRGGRRVPARLGAAHGRPRRPERPRARRRRVRVGPPCAHRAAPRRRLGAGPRARRTARTSTARASTGAQRLDAGDVVRVGETELSVEER